MVCRNSGIGRAILAMPIAVALAAFFSIGLAASDVAAAGSPFPALAGTWSGSGIAYFDGGRREKLRCKGYYSNASGASNLGLSIRCANASAKVELRANLNYSGGAVSGTWEERTYNQSGTVSGTASDDRINLRIDGNIEGAMSVALNGRRHSVSLRTAGPSLHGISISMSR